jgi:hypothetical protein
MVRPWVQYASVVVALGWLTGTATAKPILTFTDLVEPTPDIVFDTRTRTYNYTHSLLDDGFDPLRHSLGTLTLTIDVRDDTLLDKRERVAVTLDGLGPLPEASVPRHPRSTPVSVSLDGLDQGVLVVGDAELTFMVNVALVAQDGLLWVTLTRDKGDFLFRQSTLTATQTAEPATLLLLGSGLAGVIGLRYTRRPQGALAQAVPQEDRA